MTEAPIVATLKAGGNHADPWIVVRAETPQQLVERLDGIVNAGVDGSVVAAQASFAATYASSAGQNSGVSPAVQVVQSGLADPAPATWDTAGPTTPAPQQSAPPAQGAPAAGARRKEVDKFGGEWTFNHPAAPQSPHGPAVHRSWTTQAGKASNRWVDPRAKAVPGNYEAGVRSDPADLWPGDWAEPTWKLDR